MASNLDFSADAIYSPVLDRIQRGERIHDNLPRRRYRAQEKPNVKDTGDTPSEDIMVSDEDETEEHRLDLRA